MNILLGINAAGAVRISEVLPLLLPTGSEDHQGGNAWGISIHQNETARLLKDHISLQRPAYYGFSGERHIAGNGFLAQTTLSVTVPAYADIAPFERELGGRSWTFIHDSDLQNLDQYEVTGYHPIGQTAAERAFCLLLDTARDYLAEDGGIPDPEKMLHRLARQTSVLTAHGHFNFMLSNGDTLFVHSHTRLDVLLSDTQEQPVCLVASQKMTDDDFWSCLLPNTLTMIRNGKILAQVRTENPVSEAVRQRHVATLGRIQANRYAALAERHQRAGDGHLYESS